MCHIISLLVEEHQHGPRPGFQKRLDLRLEGLEWKRQPVSVDIHTDAKDLVTRVYSLKASLDVSKRRRIDIADIQECIEEGDISRLSHIRGATNPVDIGTKNVSMAKEAYKRYLRMVYDGHYVPDITAADVRSSVVKRKSLIALQECFADLE